MLSGQDSQRMTTAESVNGYRKIPKVAFLNAKLLMRKAYWTPFRIATGAVSLTTLAQYA